MTTSCCGVSPPLLPHIISRWGHSELALPALSGHIKHSDTEPGTQQGMTRSEKPGHSEQSGNRKHHGQEEHGLRFSKTAQMRAFSPRCDCQRSSVAWNAAAGAEDSPKVPAVQVETVLTAEPSVAHCVATSGYHRLDFKRLQHKVDSLKTPYN